MRYVSLFLIICVSVFGAKSPAWIDGASEAEFSRFNEQGITLKNLEKTWAKVSSDLHFKRYKVIRSKVYGPNSPIKELLKVLVKNFPVPDLDFIYYHQDILRKEDLVRAKMKESKVYAPIFVSAKKKSEDRLVLFIDYVYLINDFTTGWNRLLQLITENHGKYDWSSKTEKALWRGAASDAIYSWENWQKHPRGHAVYLSEYVYPNLIDAAFTHYGKFSNESVDQPLFNERLGLRPFMPQVDQMKYKYLVDIDGVSCSGTSLKWKLLSGSLVMKQDSADVMWFSSQLIPWEHYVPLKKDVSDLVEKVLWARKNDEDAKQIGENGRAFALEHLTPEHTLLYCFKVLKKYASLQRFQPKV